MHYMGLGIAFMALVMIAIVDTFYLLFLIGSLGGVDPVQFWKTPRLNLWKHGAIIEKEEARPERLILI
jgi:hypothetical protein